MDAVSTEDTTTRGLRVLTADEDAAALERTATLLEGLGHEVTACAASVSEACSLILRDDPDVAVVVVHDDVDHALDLIEEIAEASTGPVIALLDEADREFAEAAAERGLSALAAEPTAEGLQAAIEVAVRRHGGTPLRAGLPARARARAAGDHRAGQGHPHGAPRPGRARCVRATARRG